MPSPTLLLNRLYTTCSTPNSRHTSTYRSPYQLERCSSVVHSFFLLHTAEDPLPLNMAREMLWKVFHCTGDKDNSKYYLLLMCAHAVTVWMNKSWSIPFLLSHAVGTILGRGVLNHSASLERRRSVLRLKKQSPAKSTATASTTPTTSLVRLKQCQLHAIIRGSRIFNEIWSKFQLLSWIPLNTF